MGEPPVPGSHHSILSPDPSPSFPYEDASPPRVDIRLSGSLHISSPSSISPSQQARAKGLLGNSHDGSAQAKQYLSGSLDLRSPQSASAGKARHAPPSEKKGACYMSDSLGGFMTSSQDKEDTPRDNPTHNVGHPTSTPVNASEKPGACVDQQSPNGPAAPSQAPAALTSQHSVVDRSKSSQPTPPSCSAEAGNDADDEMHDKSCYLSGSLCLSSPLTASCPPVAAVPGNAAEENKPAASGSLSPGGANEESSFNLDSPASLHPHVPGLELDSRNGAKLPPGTPSQQHESNFTLSLGSYGGDLRARVSTPPEKLSTPPPGSPVDRDRAGAGMHVSSTHTPPHHSHASEHRGGGAGLLSASRAEHSQAQQEDSRHSQSLDFHRSEPSSSEEESDSMRYMGWGGGMGMADPFQRGSFSSPSFSTLVSNPVDSDSLQHRGEGEAGPPVSSAENYPYLTPPVTSTVQNAASTTAGAGGAANPNPNADLSPASSSAGHTGAVGAEEVAPNEPLDSSQEPPVLPRKEDLSLDLGSTSGSRRESNASDAVEPEHGEEEKHTAETCSNKDGVVEAGELEVGESLQQELSGGTAKPLVAEGSVGEHIQAAVTSEAAVVTHADVEAEGRVSGMNVPSTPQQHQQHSHSQQHEEDHHASDGLHASPTPLSPDLMVPSNAPMWEVHPIVPVLPSSSIGIAVDERLVSVPPSSTMSASAVGRLTQGSARLTETEVDYTELDQTEIDQTMVSQTQIDFTQTQIDHTQVETEVDHTVVEQTEVEQTSHTAMEQTSHTAIEQTSHTAIEQTSHTAIEQTSHTAIEQTEVERTAVSSEQVGGTELDSLRVGGGDRSVLPDGSGNGEVSAGGAAREPSHSSSLDRCPEWSLCRHPQVTPHGEGDVNNSVNGVKSGLNEVSGSTSQPSVERKEWSLFAPPAQRTTPTDNGANSSNASYYSNLGDAPVQKLQGGGGSSGVVSAPSSMYVAHGDYDVNVGSSGEIKNVKSSSGSIGEELGAANDDNVLDIGEGKSHSQSQSQHQHMEHEEEGQGSPSFHESLHINPAAGDLSPKQSPMQGSRQSEALTFSDEINRKNERACPAAPSVAAFWCVDGPPEPEGGGMGGPSGVGAVVRDPTPVTSATELDTDVSSDYHDSSDSEGENMRRDGKLGGYGKTAALQHRGGARGGKERSPQSCSQDWRNDENVLVTDMRVNEDREDSQHQQPSPSPNRMESLERPLSPPPAPDAHAVASDRDRGGWIKAKGVTVTATHEPPPPPVSAHIPMNAGANGMLDVPQHRQSIDVHEQEESGGGVEAFCKLTGESAPQTQQSLAGVSTRESVPCSGRCNQLESPVHSGYHANCDHQTFTSDSAAMSIGLDMTDMYPTPATTSGGVTETRTAPESSLRVQKVAPPHPASVILPARVNLQAPTAHPSCNHVQSPAVDLLCGKRKLDSVSLQERGGAFASDVSPQRGVSTERMQVAPAVIVQSSARLTVSEKAPGKAVSLQNDVNLQQDVDQSRAAPSPRMVEQQVVVRTEGAGPAKMRTISEKRLRLIRQLQENNKARPERLLGIISTVKDLTSQSNATGGQRQNEGEVRSSRTAPLIKPRVPKSSEMLAPASSKEPQKKTSAKNKAISNSVSEEQEADSYNTEIPEKISEKAPVRNRGSNATTDRKSTTSSSNLHTEKSTESSVMKQADCSTSDRKSRKNIDTVVGAGTDRTKDWSVSKAKNSVSGDRLLDARAGAPHSQQRKNLPKSPGPQVEVAGPRTRRQSGSGEAPALKNKKPQPKATPKAGVKAGGHARKRAVSDDPFEYPSSSPPRTQVMKITQVSKKGSPGGSSTIASRVKSAAQKSPAKIGTSTTQPRKVTPSLKEKGGGGGMGKQRGGKEVDPFEYVGGSSSCSSQIQPKTSKNSGFDRNISTKKKGPPSPWLKRKRGVADSDSEEDQVVHADTYTCMNDPISRAKKRKVDGTVAPRVIPRGRGGEGMSVDKPPVSNVVKASTRSSKTTTVVTSPVRGRASQRTTNTVVSIHTEVASTHVDTEPSKIGTRRRRSIRFPSSSPSSSPPPPPVIPKSPHKHTHAHTYGRTRSSSGMVPASTAVKRVRHSVCDMNEHETGSESSYACSTDSIRPVRAKKKPKRNEDYLDLNTQQLTGMEEGEGGAWGGGLEKSTGKSSGTKGKVTVKTTTHVVQQKGRVNTEVCRPIGSVHSKSRADVGRVVQVSPAVSSTRTVSSGGKASPCRDESDSCSTQPQIHTVQSPPHISPDRHNASRLLRLRASLL